MRETNFTMRKNYQGLGEQTMTVGVSTSNLYPMRTEQALIQLLESGFKTVEIFLNTESESKPFYAKKMHSYANSHRARISALHSYNSISESYMYFTDYRRRLEDGIKQLDNVFKTASAIGAPYVIIHGDRPAGPLSDEDSIRRFGFLYDLGQKRGVTLLLENVLKYRSAGLEYIRLMRYMLADKAQFVFDLKQCIRCKLDPLDVLSAMSGGVRHVHISDNTEQFDCLLPGRGNTDYSGLINHLHENGYNGDLIIELYRNNFDSLSDLIEARNFLNEALI